MRPKQLKCPFTWKTRRPTLCDRVLYVPEYYDKHQEFVFPGWAHPDVFGKQAPVAVEFCSGNGAWILEKALAYPEQHWVAVEMQFERVRKIWSKIHNFKLKNLFVVCGEALTFTRYYVPSKSVAAVYVNFPDPWPKAKHAKNRLLKEPFLSEMSRICQLEAKATLVTDHVDYMLEVTTLMQENPCWESCFPFPHYVTEYEHYGTSYFDALWREQGIPIHYMQYINKA